MAKNFFWDIGEAPPNVPQKYYYSLGNLSQPHKLHGITNTIKESFMPHIPYMIGAGAIGFILGWKLRKFWSGPAF